MLHMVLAENIPAIFQRQEIAKLDKILSKKPKNYHICINAAILALVKKSS